MLIEFKKPQAGDHKTKTRYCLFPRIYTLHDRNVFVWLHTVTEEWGYEPYEDGYDRYDKWTRLSVQF